MSAPKVGAQAVPVPTQLSADALQLGTSSLEARQGTVLGRLALSSRRPAIAPAATPSGSTTASSPAGSLGLATGGTSGDPPSKPGTVRP